MASKLDQLRLKLRQLSVDAFIVGSGDAHQSEYVSESDKRRQFISDFSGSAGTVLVLQDKALLWTDGRYFLQAEHEINQDWTLMKSGQPGVLELPEWVVANLASGQVVGVDPLLIPNGSAAAMTKLFATKDIKLIPVQNNPIDEVWNSFGKSVSVINPLVALDIDKTGRSLTDKVAQMQSFIRKQGATSLLISMLDEIAWLYNIRGGDVEFNPVALAYAVVTLQKAFLFVDVNKVTEAVRVHLGEGVEIRPYDSIREFLQEQSKDGAVVMDPAQANWAMYSAVGTNVVSAMSPVLMPKSVKNETELHGFRQAHIRDGVALTAFLHWLERNVTSDPNFRITEYEVAQRLEEFRGKIKDHRGPSFDTIAGYAANGAIIHYKPAEKGCAVLGRDSTFLLDSGAQYLDGTTDVTRTVHFGTPTQHMKNTYTAVLKGHIELATVVMPQGTLGSRIDALARLALWKQGLDYNHGTGHGVGSYLNVHEGPQGIGFRRRDNEVGFEIGMTISNEPGYYEDGNFGIRIENLCIAVKVDTPHNFLGKEYLGFETVTMCPIATNLINQDMLTTSERTWLNDYHALVREKLLPGIQELFPETVAFLKERTEAI